MQESFLHYLWKHKKINTANLQTTQGEAIVINSVGQHNTNAGPDFFNAQITIDNQLWAGNVEIHVNASDWFLHNHEKDTAYDNVILHVVWEHDTDVFRNSNTTIPTLQLKNYISETIINDYKTLFNKEDKWINCQHDFEKTDAFLINNWLERLFFERLQQKTEAIETLLKTSMNNWEAVLFKLMAKNFGLKVNADAFFSISQSVNFSVIRKTQSNKLSLEALLFGQAGLLQDTVQEPYYISLQNEYVFLKQKFSLSTLGVMPIQFFRLRPLNFPTIRLAQLASLYNEHQNLFSKIIETNSLEGFYNLFSIETSPFWKTHYTFQKTSKETNKALTKSFINLLLINTILPIKFCYAKHKGNVVNDEIIELALAIASEKNSIITAFNKLKKVSKSSLQSQALLQLKNEYCSKNKCLQCAIGNSILNK